MCTPIYFCFYNSMENEKSLVLVVVESIFRQCNAFHFKAKRTSNLHFCRLGKQHENGKYTK